MYRRCDLWRHSKTITWFARIPPGKTFVFWQPARKCMQSYHDYASFCPAKHDVYSVFSTEGGLNVNIGHIVYKQTEVGMRNSLVLFWTMNNISITVIGRREHDQDGGNVIMDYNNMYLTWNILWYVSSSVLSPWRFLSKLCRSVLRSSYSILWPLGPNCISILSALL